MRTQLLFFFLLFSIVSCRKETNQAPYNPIAPTAPILRTGTGSYYIYDIFKVDSNGLSTPYGRPDTIRIVGDSVINGNTYVHLYDTWFNIGTRHLFFRDSSGHVVDAQGVIHWANRNLPDTTVYQDYNSLVITYAFGRGNQPFQLPAGKVNGTLFPMRPTPAYELLLNSYFVNGQKMSVCDSGYYARRLFVPGIGLAIDQLTWFNEHYAYCNYYERRLTYYELNL